MRRIWIYDKGLFVLAFITALALGSGVAAFGAGNNATGSAQGSTVIYTTNGGLGEAYVPRHKKKSPPRNVEPPDETFLNEGYIPQEKEPVKHAVKSRTVKGSTIIYSTGGGLGEGYVSRPKKKAAPRHVAFPEEKKKPIKSTVIYTTGEEAAKASTQGTIAPGWHPTEDHSLDSLKGFFHRILPPAKKGVAEKRAGKVDSGFLEEGYNEDERPSSTVITDTGSAKKEQGAVLNGGVAPGWQSSGGHPVRDFFHRVWPGGKESAVGGPAGEIQTGAAAPSKAISGAPEVSGGTAAVPAARPLSERRSGRSAQTPSTGVTTPVEEIKVTAQDTAAPEDEEDFLEDEEDIAGLNGEEAPLVSDPIEGFNRAMFKFNDKVYFWFFRPVALGYSYVVPEPGRVAVRRFFDNIFMPVRFANNVLQFKFKNAGVEVTRFVINSTLGVAGFMDPAKKWWNLEMHEEDFGQTLGFYGFGPGIYLNLPVFGPSNIRDTIGMVADIFTSPTAYILPNDREIVVGIDVYRRVNEASLNIGLYEGIKRDALDPYIFIRNAYQQHRESEIKK